MQENVRFEFKLTDGATGPLRDAARETARVAAKVAGQEPRFCVRYQAYSETHRYDADPASEDDARALAASLKASGLDAWHDVDR